MKKKSLLALILVASLLLSGCSLVTTDTAADYARTILDVNGHTVNKYEFLNNMEGYAENLYNYYTQQYGDATAAGLTNEILTNQALSYAKNDYIQNYLELDKAKELGLDQLTVEDEAKVAEIAAEYYDMVKQQVAQVYLVGSTNTGDALLEEADAYIKAHEEIRSYDSCVEMATDTVLKDKVHEYFVQDVVVGDVELQEAYDSTVEQQKANYEANPSLYSSDVLNGENVYYTPAGYRMVKHILIKLDDENMTALSNAKTALDNAQNQVDIEEEYVKEASEGTDQPTLSYGLLDAMNAYAAADEEYTNVKAAALATIQEKADEILALAKAEGADFESLIAEYSTDNMPADGYPICEGNTAFVSEFVEAGMALENIGDISDLVATTYGYHIIQYVADVEEGTVDFETAKATLYDTVLSEKQDNIYNEYLTSWTNAADIKFYEDRLGLSQH